VHALTPPIDNNLGFAFVLISMQKGCPYTEDDRDFQYGSSETLTIVLEGNGIIRIMSFIKKKSKAKGLGHIHML
jgi:hypothetical protein